jgi:outer membrane protein assembly factor BamD (BamD/ComL family)
MQKLLTISLIALIALFAACSPPRKNAVDRISALEKQMAATAGKPDSSKVEMLTNAYTDFARQFPKDSLAPEYLLKAGGVLMNAGKGLKAVEALDQLTRKYASSRQAPQALFLEAFIYENLIVNLPKAGELYRQFLFRFPNHDMADDAQASLNNLGKSPEELVREFEAKAADSAKVARK